MGSLTIIHLLNSQCWSWSRRGWYEPRFWLNVKRKMGHHQNFHLTNCLPAFDWSCSCREYYTWWVDWHQHLVLDTLPAEFDNHVKAMEVDKWPTETYKDIGGLEKQIEELVEAIVLPMEQADKIKTIEIKPPKVWYSLSFWLPTNSHQELGKPFLHMHALPWPKHVTWNKRCK